MAECAINRWGQGKFKGFSAGSHPKGAIHPMTIEVLNALKYDTSALRSKSWDEFADPDALTLDFIFTVCDQAAAEQCPVWLGRPISAHWGVSDPAAFEGTDDEKRRFFMRIYRELEHRIRAFVALDLDALDERARKECLAKIGNRKLSHEQ